MNQILKIVVIALLAGLIIGALLSYGGSYKASAKGRNWTDIDSPPDFNSVAVKSIENLKHTGHFGTVATTTIVDTPDIEVPKIAPFPAILTVQTVDGVPFVTLQSAARQIKTYGQGDQIENGWRIISIDLSKIVAELDGERTEFIVFPSANK